MEIATTIVLIGAIATAAAAGIAALPWRGEELDAASGAVHAVANALGGAATTGFQGGEAPESFGAGGL